MTTHCDGVIRHHVAQRGIAECCVQRKAPEPIFEFSETKIIKIREE